MIAGEVFMSWLKVKRVDIFMVSGQGRRVRSMLKIRSEWVYIKTINLRSKVKL